MLIRIVITTVLFLMISTPVLFAGEETLLALDPLISEVLEKNPQLQAARHQTAAAGEQIRQARAWDPPQAGIEFYQVPIGSFPNPIKDNMEYDYYVEQMIPFPGKIGAMTKAAERNKEMVAQNYEALEKRVIRDLKTAYYELYLVQRKIGLNEENQDLMRNFTVTARKQYEVGMGKQADILRAQTELSMLINEGINLRQESKTVEAMLNSILNRPTDQPLGRVPDLAENGAGLSFERIGPLAVKNRPELLAMQKNIEMNEAEVMVAEKELKPEFMVRFMYKDMADTTEDFWSTMVGVTIPLAPWSKNKFKGKIEETRINVMKARKDLRAMENMVLFEVRNALVKVESQRNLVGLFESTVIPQAEQTLRSTSTSYQTGGTEFLMLIDAYGTLLTARLEYHMAVMNLMSGLASLEQATGLPIEDIVSRQGGSPTASRVSTKFNPAETE